MSLQIVSHLSPLGFPLGIFSFHKMDLTSSISIHWSTRPCASHADLSLSYLIDSHTVSPRAPPSHVPRPALHCLSQVSLKVTLYPDKPRTLDPAASNSQVPGIEYVYHMVCVCVSLFKVIFLFIFEIGSHYIALAALELTRDLPASSPLNTGIKSFEFNHASLFKDFSDYFWHFEAGSQVTQPQTHLVC